jgi:phosphonate transport system substrate-binding protein
MPSVPSVAAAAILGLLCVGCQGAPPAASALCGDSGELRVGLVGGAEGATPESEGWGDDAAMFELRDRLRQASRCEVEVEPVRSPDLARSRLEDGAWDVAFLPPGLMAFSMTRPQPYAPIRALGTPRRSRSSIVVAADSPIASLQQLQGKRVGLLPRGSLTGFYLPLYNMHGLNLGQVVYALDYDSLLSLLQSGKVDAIAWDETVPEPEPPLRRLFTDRHPVPLGAMVMSQALSAADVGGFLAGLDGAARELPARLGYVPGDRPTDPSAETLQRIVVAVESWNLPLNGKPYSVFDPARS